MLSHFEKLIQDRMTELAVASVNVSLGDSHKHAMIKGQYEEAKNVLAIYRRSMRIADDEDAA